MNEDKPVGLIGSCGHFVPAGTAAAAYESRVSPTGEAVLVPLYFCRRCEAEQVSPHIRKVIRNAESTGRRQAR